MFLVNVTPQQRKRAREILSKWNQKRFGLAWQNCVSLEKDIAKAVGLNVPEFNPADIDTWYPPKFVSILRSTNDKDTPIQSSAREEALEKELARLEQEVIEDRRQERARAEARAAAREARDAESLRRARAEVAARRAQKEAARIEQEVMEKRRQERARAEARAAAREAGAWRAEEAAEARRMSREPVGSGHESTKNEGGGRRSEHQGHRDHVRIRHN